MRTLAEIDAEIALVRAAMTSAYGAASYEKDSSQSRQRVTYQSLDALQKRLDYLLSERRAVEDFNNGSLTEAMRSC